VDFTEIVVLFYRLLDALPIDFAFFIFVSVLVDNGGKLAVKGVEPLSDEVFHAIGVKGADKAPHSKNEHSNDTTYNAEHFGTAWEVQNVMVDNAVIVKGDIALVLVRENICVLSTEIFRCTIVVALTASPEVFVGDQ
jgi:hypothetical protein